MSLSIWPINTGMIKVDVGIHITQGRNVGDKTFIPALAWLIQGGEKLTGVGKTVTPGIICSSLIERSIPGIPEAMRATGREKTPKAMLSRGVAGIRGQTLMINLPGSPSGVAENIQVLLPVIEHALEIASGCSGDCGGDIQMGKTMTEGS